MAVIGLPAGVRSRRFVLPRIQSAAITEVALITVGFYIWLVGVRDGWHMQDFTAFRHAADELLHGRSPYPLADPAVLTSARQLVYPPLVGYLFTPFALVPYGVAGPVYFVLLLAALALSLRLLGVRDRRVLAAVMIWYPTVACLGTGAIGPFLAVLLAVAWRWRDRATVVAAAVALACVAKLFLWPLLLWLVATRRWRAACFTVAAGAAAFLLSFAQLGVDVLERYPTLLRALDSTFGARSFSGFTFFRSLGASPTETWPLVICVGLALAWAIFEFGRRGRDADAFTIAIAAALILSPIVWMHYYVLLVVPIALSRPTLSGLWFVPLLYWASPQLESEGDAWRLLVGIGVTTAVVATAVRTRPEWPGTGVRVQTHPRVLNIAVDRLHARR